MTKLIPANLVNKKSHNTRNNIYVHKGHNCIRRSIYKRGPGSGGVGVRGSEGQVGVGV